MEFEFPLAFAAEWNPSTLPLYMGSPICANCEHLRRPDKLKNEWYADCTVPWPTEYLPRWAYEPKYPARGYLNEKQIDGPFTPDATFADCPTFQEKLTNKDQN